MHLACWYCLLRFVNPSLQCCYKENVRRSDDHQCISHVGCVSKKTIINAPRMLVLFCKPILAVLLQRKHLTIINRFVNPSLQCYYKTQPTRSSMHLACWSCWLRFVNPSLQCCYKENIRRSLMHIACLLCFLSPTLPYLCSPNEDFGRPNQPPAVLKRRRTSRVKEASYQPC